MIDQTPPSWLNDVLKRLLADIDDDMEFAGTMFKTKESAAKQVSRDIRRAAQAIWTKHLEVVREAEHQTMVRELGWCLRNSQKSIANRLEALHSGSKGENHG